MPPMAAVLTVGQCLLWKGHSQPVALEGQWFLSGSRSIGFTLKKNLRGIYVRGKQQCQLCSKGHISGWT